MRWLIALAGMLLMAGNADAASCRHWVGSWEASPSDASPSVSLSQRTARMIIAPHLGGHRLRIRLSNRYGSEPIRLGPVTIARRQYGAAIDARSRRPVRFAGKRTVVLDPGRDVLSDPVDLRVRAFEDLAVSLAVPRTTVHPTEHFITRQTSYLGTGDRAAQASGRGFVPATTTFSTGWYFLSGLDVVAPRRVGAVVAFGDSTTDGFQGRIKPVGEDLSTMDRDVRYPDWLQRRIDAAGLPLSVLNAGIGGNQILHDGLSGGYGPSGIQRLSADALHQAGVTSVIIYEGINDIGAASSPRAIIGGLRTLIARTHRAGLRAMIATITPAVGTIVPSYNNETTRGAVNAWIRHHSGADAVFDFDRAVRRPHDHHRLVKAYDADHLHLTPRGYAALAGAVRLKRLAVPAGSCG